VKSTKIVRKEAQLKFSGKGGSLPTKIKGISKIGTEMCPKKTTYFTWWNHATVWFKQWSLPRSMVTERPSELDTFGPVWYCLQCLSKPFRPIRTEFESSESKKLLTPPLGCKKLTFLLTVRWNSHLVLSKSGGALPFCPPPSLARECPGGRCHTRPSRRPLGGGGGSAGGSGNGGRRRRQAV